MEGIIIVLLVTLLLSETVSSSTKGVYCYIGSHLYRPTDGRRVIRCPDGQQCYIRKYESTLAFPLYDMGCEPNLACTTLASMKGKRSAVQKRQRTINDWSHCCQNDFCNGQYDDDGNVTSQSEVRCFHCNFMRDPAQCDTVTTCHHGDVCSTVEITDSSGDSGFKLTCMSRTLCEDIGHFERLGRRHTKRRELCRACCEQSYCNLHFCSNYTDGWTPPVPLGTTPPSVTITTQGPFVTIIQGPQNHTVKPGSRVVLRCRAIGFPTPRFTWEIRDTDGVVKRASSGVDAMPSRTVLIIPKTALKDAGSYTCVATSAGKSASETAHLYIGESPPHITIGPLSQNAKSGARIKLHCEATGDPNPRIEWSFHSAAGDNRFPASTYVTLDRQLTLYPASPEHDGTWTCVATSPAGLDSASAVLTVS